MKKIILFISLLTIPFYLLAQNISGTVYGLENEKEVPLVGAVISVINSGSASLTDNEGNFSINSDSKIIIVSYVGFASDTVEITGNENLKIVLSKTFQLKGVVIQSQREETYISKLNNIKTEVITGEGLKKNACCNLAESFESNPSLDASVADAVSGNKQIQMLGLSGIYVQMQTDLLPSVHGLNILSAMNDIPGSFIHAIQIRKGPGSVSNGYEAITGQINIELLKPIDAKKLFVNVYGDNQQRIEGNIYFTNRINKWNALTTIHASNQKLKMDRNNDSFLDQPLYTRINLSHSWQHISQHGKQTLAGIKFNNYESDAGQRIQSGDIYTSRPFLTVNDYKRYEAFVKSCFEIGNNESNELGLQAQFNHQENTQNIGDRRFTGNENSFFFNSILQLVSKNTFNIIRSGLSLRYDSYNEKLDSFSFANDDVIPGVFVEHTYDRSKKISIITGLRLDQFNDESLILTPRLHIRYKLNDKGSIRASAGYGWRNPHIVNENIQFLYSSRTLFFDEPIKLERAWNYGVNYVQDFMIKEKKLELSIDAYRTDFQNMAYADLDINKYELHFYNVKNAKSTSIQMQLTFDASHDLTFMLAGKYNLVEIQNLNYITIQKVLTPNYRGLANVAYKIFKDHLKIDATLQFIGTQRLPASLSDNSGLFYTQSYIKLLSQITYEFKNCEAYVGSENLNNFNQSNPIINYQQPFQQGFDASQIWAPINGRVIYVGFRYNILNKKEK